MPAISISKGGPAKSDSDASKPSPANSTELADKDLESIGRHCQFAYCGQLDFLPFRCASCQGTFCLDHRSETAHKCPKPGEWARRNYAESNTHTTTEKPNIYNSDQCAHVACKTLINTMRDPAVRCPECNREYCLKHRLREEHNCSKDVPLGARPAGNAATTNETFRSMFSRVRTWGKDKSQAATAGLTPKPKANSPAARMTEVNNMKRSAKGDPAVPADRRLYLHVVGTSDTQTNQPPTGDFYFDKNWKVGRVLDDAAKRLRVENLNNRVGEEARLRIFHVESGDFLEFSESIGQGKVASGNTIVMLRGAGVMLGK